MKKFVLHCNRCTVATEFFDVTFVPKWKEGTIGEVDKQKKNFCQNQSIVLLQNKFPNCPKWSGKEEQTFI